jgi:hypothetical protein
MCAYVSLQLKILLASESQSLFTSVLNCVTDTVTETVAHRPHLRRQEDAHLRIQVVQRRALLVHTLACVIHGPASGVW